MNRHDATIGTVQGNAEHHRIMNNRGYRQFVATLIKDKLVSLAEAVGVLACENPEQGLWGKNLHADSDELVQKISKTIGIEITPPPIDGGLLKIKTSRGLFHERDLNAVYTAYLIKQLMRDKTPSTICEIGAGSGRVAYWCQRLGFTSYTILDLPHINVIHGYYLLKTLPKSKILLYGENDNHAADCLRILPAIMKESLGSGENSRYGLIVNQDSFPEMSKETVFEYLQWIKRVSGGYFLSINHESKPRSTENNFQISVPESAEEARGFHRTLRMPYWLRKGYIIELYTVGNDS